MNENVKKYSWAGIALLTLSGIRYTLYRYIYKDKRINKTEEDTKSNSNKVSNSKSNSKQITNANNNISHGVSVQSSSSMSDCTITNANNNNNAGVIIIRSSSMSECTITASGNVIYQIYITATATYSQCILTPAPTSTAWAKNE